MQRESRSRNADNITVANVTDLTGETDIAGYKNNYLAGVELDWESSKNRGYLLNPATVTGVSLYDPNPDDAYTGTIGPATSFTNTVTRTTSAYVFDRSEEQTSELQSLMRNSYAVFCLKKKT